MSNFTISRGRTPSPRFMERGLGGEWRGRRERGRRKGGREGSREMERQDIGS